MGSALLTQTLEAVTSERVLGFDRSFDLARALLGQYGEDDLAERLSADIPLSCPWEVVADLFGILIWTTSDNGGALMRTAEAWLRAGRDARRVRVALNLDLYPFTDPAEMQRVLRRVAEQLPEVAQECGQFVASRCLSGGQAELSAAPDRGGE